MDSEKSVYLWTIFILSLKTFCVRKNFYAHKKYLWKETTDNTHFRGYLILYLYLPPYNLSSRYFEI